MGFHVIRDQLSSKGSIIDSMCLVAIDSDGLPRCVSIRSRTKALTFENEIMAEACLDQCRKSVPENKLPNFKWRLESASAVTSSPGGSDAT